MTERTTPSLETQVEKERKGHRSQTDQQSVKQIKLDIPRTTLSFVRPIWTIRVVVAEVSPEDTLASILTHPTVRVNFAKEKLTETFPLPCLIRITKCDVHIRAVVAQRNTLIACAAK